VLSEGVGWRRLRRRRSRLRAARIDAVWPALLLAATAATPGCFAVNRMSGMSEAREIQRVGERTDAVVIDIWDTGMTLNHDPVVGLLVRVEPSDRAPYEARIDKSVVSRVHVPQVQPGSRVRVYVDPHNPARVALGLYDLRD
jgi:hypothetical protein